MAIVLLIKSDTLIRTAAVSSSHLVPPRAPITEEDLVGLPNPGGSWCVDTPLFIVREICLHCETCANRY